MFLAKKTDPKGKRWKMFPFLNERGNLLIWYVFMLPVFMGAVALAVDMSNVASMRSSLQLSADAATQGTVSLSKNQTSGKPRYSSTSEAQAQAIRIYDANRSGLNHSTRVKEGIPFLKCQTKDAGKGVLVKPSGSKCGFQLVEFKYSSNGGLSNGGYITMTVQEKADTIFLHFIGFDELTYTITSTARLTSTYN